MNLLWVLNRLNNLGPNREAHNERVKLFALGFNAIGLAALIGGLVAPIFDPTRQQGALFAIIGVGIWMVFLVAAFQMLGYIKAKD
ncbi:MAG: hypothetical protein ABL883_08925 [Terricaulis sp.]